jgi:hypothetical protein
MLRLASNAARMWLRVNDAMKEMPVIEDLVCEFDGEIDVQVTGDSRWWECPWCGQEHNDTLDYERDWDAEAKDARLERGDR